MTSQGSSLIVRTSEGAEGLSASVIMMVVLTLEIVTPGNFLAVACAVDSASCLADGCPSSDCSNVKAFAAACAASLAAAFSRVARMVIAANTISGMAPHTRSNQSTIGSSTIWVPHGILGLPRPLVCIPASHPASHPFSLQCVLRPNNAHAALLPNVFHNTPAAGDVLLALVAVTGALSLDS